MKKENQAFQDFVKPVLVLLVICAVVAGLLSAVNALTAPVIEENTRKEAEENRLAALPGASSFTEEEVPEGDDFSGVTGIFKEDSGLGYVITCSNKGYGGDVTVTVGIGADGKILGLIADVSTETSGVGSKAGDDGYIGKFLGGDFDSASSVDTISAATYSSTAVKNGVLQALQAFDTLEGE